MENKSTDDQIERRIKDIMTEKIPEPEIVNQKMEAAYKEIRGKQVSVKRKIPAAVKFSTAAAILALVMVYCVKNPAVAAQIPFIGNIFRGLEGQVSFPGDYSKNSVKVNIAADNKDENVKPKQPDIKNDHIQSETEADSTQSGPDQKNSKTGGVTVTFSEAAYDYNAIYIALLVQNEEGFTKDTLDPNALCYDAQVKLYKADGSADEFNYESEGRFVRTIEGEFVDPHTFKGIFRFCESGFDLSSYTSCELTFWEFEQQLTTGETETIIVPDYGEVSQLIPDSVHYKGPWKFQLDFDGVEISEQEIIVHDKNDKGLGIEKVVKTEFEIYAVPLLPEGEKSYDYIAAIWDADGKPLESRNWGDYLSMSHYGRDVSKVTVYLLRAEDFFETKGNNAYLQPEKAVYQTTISFED